MNGIALLVGIFGAPLLLLGAGRRFRSRSRRHRAVFWGGVIGYGIAVLGVNLALMLEPVMWTEATPLRAAIVFWGLVAGAGAGAGLGALRSAWVGGPEG